jgi:hypothetical protein
MPHWFLSINKKKDTYRLIDTTRVANRPHQQKQHKQKRNLYIYRFKTGCLRDSFIPRSPGPGLYKLTCVDKRSAPATSIGTGMRFMGDPGYNTTAAARGGGGGVGGGGEGGSVGDASSSVITTSAQSSVGSSEFEPYETPGPGTYQLSSTLGEQSNSLHSTANRFRFATSAQRPSAHSNVRAPGPGSYGDQSGLGLQSNSRLKSSPQVKFGTSKRGSATDGGAG